MLSCLISKKTGPEAVEKTKPLQKNILYSTSTEVRIEFLHLVTGGYAKAQLTKKSNFR